MRDRTLGDLSGVPRSALGLVTERHRRIATEGALLGGLLAKWFARERAIVSDGAEPFAILLHAWCGVHAERLIHTLIPRNERQRQEQQRVRGEIWTCYADLTAYQRAPHPEAIAELRARLTATFTQKTSFATLNQTLTRLHAHQAELLLVRLRPDSPLHTNGSENDSRGDVKWRKISGGTRSDLGRRCRDTFAKSEKDLPHARNRLLGRPQRPHWAGRCYPALVRERS